jgi:hypothetical protein
MKTIGMPKRIQKWAEKNSHLVENIHMERDSFDPASQYSVWLLLKKGWGNGDPASHIIHESAVSHFFEAVTLITKCDCENCRT